MNKIVDFSLNYSREIVATALVAAFFLYFWINGPIMQQIELLNIEHIETKYSKPVIVGTHGVNTKQSVYNTISDEEEHLFGHGLILDKKQARPTYGLLADVHNNPGLSQEIASNVLAHAKKFSNDSINVQLIPSIDMYFATIKDESGKVKQVYLESTEIIRNIRGYAGDINVGVMLNADGSIADVYHISSKETESYLQKIKTAGYYEQYKKTTLTKGVQQIDATSGATLTTETIAKTVTALIHKGTPEPIDSYAELDSVNTFGINAELNKIWIVHIVVIFLMFLYGFQKKLKKSKKSVLILSALSVVYIGFFLNNSFTYISFIHPFVGTSVSSLVGLYSLMVLLGAIWGKNTYCKYVCPFGNIQRLINHISPIKSKRFFLSNKWIKRVRAALAIILLAGVLLGLRSWSNFEVFPDLFGAQIATLWFVVAVITVLATMVYPMIWCRLLCPTGSVLDGISDLMNYKKKRK